MLFFYAKPSVVYGLDKMLCYYLDFGCPCVSIKSRKYKSFREKVYVIYVTKQLIVNMVSFLNCISLRRITKIRGGWVNHYNNREIKSIRTIKTL